MGITFVWRISTAMAPKSISSMLRSISQRQSPPPLLSPFPFLIGFFRNDPSQTSVEYVVAIKYSAAEVADCIQIGRITYLGGQPERCTHIFDWPTEWTENAKSGQTYTASIDVSSANYEWPAGAYTVNTPF